MPIQETELRTIGDLVNEVRAIIAASSQNQQWLFRGQANACWLLLPSIHRGYSAQQERYLTNEFRVRAGSRHFSCPNSDDYPSWLALMQHYGLPTRLLDWTYSPLIAAFFAVHPDYCAPQEGDERDACIWALQATRLNQSQGFEALVFPLDAVSYAPLIEPAFKNREELDTVGVAMALEHDPRIQLQQSAFTIHSNRRPLDSLNGAEQWLHKFVIRRKDICAFHEELTLLGVRKHTLFPDLASLTSELRSIHRPDDARAAL